MFKKTTSFLLLLLGSATAQANVTEVGLTPGEFRVDESGSATYNIPLNLPVGRAGVQPQLGLSYSSNNSMDGPLGVGWSLTGVSNISRCPMTPVHDGDIREVTFQDGTDADGRGLDKYCLDGQRLLLKSGTYGAAESTYYTEVDNFSIITAHGQATTTGPLYFTVENKAGETHYYGDVSTVSGLSNALTNEGLSNADAFVEPGGYTAGSVAKTWAVKAIKDVKDNFIVYNYDKPFDSDNLNEGRFNLSSIKYTGNFATGDETFATVSFKYAKTKNSFRGYMSGSYVYRDRLLTEILIELDGEEYRTYTPTFENSAFIEERTLMTSLQECVGDSCLNPTTFDWLRDDLATSTLVEFCESLGEERGEKRDYCEMIPVNTNYNVFETTSKVIGDAGDNGSTQVFDINGDGFQDLIYERSSQWRVRLGDDPSTEITLTGYGTDDFEYALSIDYNSDGVRDLLVAAETSRDNYEWWVASVQPSTITTNYCGRYIPCTTPQVINRPITSKGLGLPATGWKGQAQVMDVNGDGFEDIVFLASDRLQAYLNNGDGTLGNSSGNKAVELYNFPQEEIVFGGLNEAIQSQTASMKSASAIDINGDGRTDLIMKVTYDLSECSGDYDNEQDCEDADERWQPYRTTKYELFKSTVVNGEPKFELAQTLGSPSSMDTLRATDLNGDGLTDIVYVGVDDKWHYRLSNGVEFLDDVTTNISTDDTKKLLTQFVDLNGDGRADLLNATSTSNWNIMFSRATEYNNQIFFNFRGKKSFDSNAFIRFGDVTGDGKVDLLTSKRNREWKVHTHLPGVKEYAIDTITNGHGVYTNIEYLPMTNTGVYFFQESDNALDSDTYSPMSGMQLVNRVSTLSSDTRISRTETKREFDKELGVVITYTETTTSPAELSVDYQYGGLLVHKQGRGSLGFQMLKTLDAQTGVVTETHYNQEYGEKTFAKAKLPEFTQQRKGDKVISEARNELSVKNTAQGGLLPYVSVSEEDSFVYGTNDTVEHISTIRTQNYYDDWGNLESSAVIVTDIATSETLQTLTVNDYGSEEQKRLGRLQSTKVKKSGSDRTLITRDTEFTYYGEDGLGLLKSSTVAPGLNNELVTTYGYDAYGNKTSVAITGNSTETGNKQTRTTTSIYGTGGRFVSSTSNSLGHDITYLYDGDSADLAAGIINSLEKVDVNNQSTTNYMNNFGRITDTTSSVSKATKSKEQWYCTDRPTDCSGVDNAHYMTIEKEKFGVDVTVSPEKQTVYDRFGRILQTRVKNLDGSWITRNTEYDHRGREYRVYEPGSDTYYTETHYLDDGIGLIEKVSRQTMYGMTEVIHHVDGLVKTITDELNRESKVFTNGFGETVKTQDALQNIVEFEYDAYGNMTSSTTTVTGVNAGTNVVSTVFDDYGRKLQTDDPIKGTWNYTYNAFGEVYTQENARDEMFEFYYDVLGRKVKSFNPNEGTLCWYYDGSSKAQSIGKLEGTAKFPRVNNACDDMFADGASFSKRFGYNMKGLQDRVITEINGESYTQSQTFDDFARPLVATYPNENGQGYSTTNVYENGFLTAIRDKDGNDLKTIDSMTIRGQVETVSYGNGYEVTNAYRADNGWLESRLTKDNSGAFQQQMYLTYYDNGNVDTRQSIYGVAQGSSGTVHDYTETYSYDKLDRLRLREIDVVTGQSLPTQFNEDQNFDFDGWGNFTFKEGVGYYKYSQSDVHRLLGVYSDESHTPGNEVYNFNNQYDANGNILSDGDRNFEYSSFDKVERITKNDGSVSSVMHYDTDRQMYYKDDCFPVKGGTVRTQTTYLGTFEKVERSNTSGEPDTNFIEYKYYVANDIVITQREGKDDTTHYLHKDNLGSVVAVSDQEGEIVTQAIYDPWGKRSKIYTETAFVALQVAAVTDRGFTGHKHIEALDIIHMKGRIYDSTLGRFMQADPFVQFTNNSQSYNRYSYVLNNPLVNTDPSGYLSFNPLKKLGRSIIRGVSKIFGAKLVNMVGNALSAFCGPFAPACAAAWNYEFARAHGASSSGALKAGLTAAATTYAFQQIGSQYNEIGDANLFDVVDGVQDINNLHYFGGNWLTSGQLAGQIASHAVVGGAVSSLNGGKFGHGFFSAGVTKGLTGTYLPGGSNLSAGEIAKGTVISAVIGGTASVISGGKFANGARTAVYQYLFNHTSKADYGKIWKDVKRTWYEYWDGVAKSDPASEVAVTVASNPLQSIAVVSGAGGLALGSVRLGQLAIRASSLSWLNNPTAEGAGWLAVDIATFRMGSLLNGTLLEGGDHAIGMFSWANQSASSIEAMTATPAPATNANQTCQVPLRC